MSIYSWIRFLPILRFTNYIFNYILIILCIILTIKGKKHMISFFLTYIKLEFPTKKWRTRFLIPKMLILEVQVHCIKLTEQYIPPLWVMCLESVAHLLVMFNFSSNFLVYATVSQQFKKTLMKLCGVKMNLRNR